MYKIDLVLSESSELYCWQFTFSFAGKINVLMTEFSFEKSTFVKI